MIEYWVHIPNASKFPRFWNISWEKYFCKHFANTTKLEFTGTSFFPFQRLVIGNVYILWIELISNVTQLMRNLYILHLSLFEMISNVHLLCLYLSNTELRDNCCVNLNFWKTVRYLFLACLFCRKKNEMVDSMLMSFFFHAYKIRSWMY